MINQLLLNGIIAGSIYSLVVLGFTLIYQTTRFFPRLRSPQVDFGWGENAVCLSYTKVYICIQK